MKLHPSAKEPKRVVVTGMSAITPLGFDFKKSFIDLANGKSGIKKVDSFDLNGLPCKIAGIIPTEGHNKLSTSKYLSDFEVERSDRFIILSLIAAENAIQDAGLLSSDGSIASDPERSGVFVGSGIGGLNYIEKYSVGAENKGYRSVMPFFIPGALVNLSCGQISIKFSIKGTSLSPVSACATGLQSISTAALAISRGDADVIVAGGSESTINKVALCGFASCRSLSTKFNDNPEKASRPWDRNRDGFVMSEGCGIVILESYEHAKARNAKIYCEIVGFSCAADAGHITRSDKDGIKKVMQSALHDAQIGIDDVDYVKAHATSTQIGDLVELEAVSELFANRSKKLYMSAPKSAIGHLLGASGSAELIFAICAMQNSVIPPTINLDDPIEYNKNLIDLIPYKSKEKKILYALANSFGFGGINCSLVIKSV